MVTYVRARFDMKKLLDEAGFLCGGACCFGALHELLVVQSLQ